MPKYGAYTSVDELGEWFKERAELTGSAMWVLYHGHVIRAGSGSNGAKCAEQRDENQTTEESWSTLENYLRQQTRNGGQFTIYIAKSSGLGDRAFLAVEPGGVGVSGFPAQYVEEKFQAWKDNYELKAEIAALKNEMQSSQPWINQLGQQLVDSGVILPLIQGIAAKFLGASASGINGPGSQKTDNYDIMPEQAESMEDSLSRIARIFPDLEGALKALADFVEKNPEMAKQLVNQAQMQSNGQ